LTESLTRAYDRLLLFYAVLEIKVIIKFVSAIKSLFDLTFVSDVDLPSEFIAYALQEWLRDRICLTLYIKPGSPWENPFIESFNGTFRNDCLNRWVFSNGQEARELIEDWRLEYNLRRPHSSLGYLPPAVLAQQVTLSLNLV
jgi:hypothetical protein